VFPREGMARPNRRCDGISGQRSDIEVAALQRELGIRNQEVKIAVLRPMTLWI
jgi:hypothetical protein